MVLNKPLWCVVVLVVTLVLGALCDDVTTSDCDNGWLHHNDMCYGFRVEYETFKDAEMTCHFLGGKIAYASDQSTLDFMKFNIGKKSNYGWWYGAKVSYDKRALVPDENGYYGVGSDRYNNIPLPKTKKLTSPITTCVGVLMDSTIQGLGGIMTDVPCAVQLPYICRGDPKTVKSVINDPHFVTNFTNDVYWFSDKQDRLSYDDAMKSCAAKSMTLASARSARQMELLMQELGNRQDDRSDPWWVGLQVKDGIFTWSDKTKMDSSLIIWDRNAGRYTHYPSQCRIVLSDGTMDDKSCFVIKAPFICMKPNIMMGQFGCKAGWLRGGKSCYKLPTGMNFWRNVKYTDADKICAKLDSHPITVDSSVEKLWIVKLKGVSASYTDSIWTSLNDRKQAGKFRWADGSAPNTNLVKFSTGFENGGKCFSFNPKSKTLQDEYCDNNRFPGCQYKSKNGKCVSQNWKYYNEMCYFVPKANQMSTLWKLERPYKSQLHVCYKDASMIDNSITISPLVVKNTDVLDIYKDLNLNIWLGLSQKLRGVFQWTDGSSANLKLFNNNDYIGTDNSTSKCAVMSRNGQFRALSCSTCDCGLVICEKEIGGNGSNNMTSQISTRCLMVLLVFFLYYFKNY